MQDPNIIVLQLEDLKTSQVTEVQKNNFDYIYYGTDNLYPQYLMSLYNSVSVHASMLSVFRNFMLGDGILIEGNENQVNEYFNFIGGGLQKVIAEMCTSLTFFDELNINVIPSRGGGIGKIAVFDNTTIRANKIIDPAKGVESYWYSLDWNIATGRRHFTTQNMLFKPIEIEAFDINKPLRNKDGYCWNLKYWKKPTQIYYTTPRYASAINDLEKSARLSNLIKNNLAHGMSGQTHIHVYQDLSDTDKREKVLSGLKTKFTGDNSDNKIFLTWSTSVDGKVEVNQIPTNDSHQTLDFIYRNVNENLITANQVPPYLANITMKTGFTDVGVAIRESLEYFQNVIILPYQRLIEYVLNTLLSLNGIQAKISIVESTPFTFLAGDEMLRHSLTINEYREKILQADPLNDGRGETLMINANKLDTQENGTN